MKEKFPVLKAREIIRVLEKAGFYIHHQRGSHVQMKHSEHKTLRVTIPFHSGDIPRQILQSILKQSQLTLDEFIKLI